MRDKLGRFIKGQIPHNKGLKPSKETRRKISEGHKGKKLSEEHKQKLSQNNARYWLGKKLYKKTKQKLSKSRMGKMTGKENTSWKGDNAGYVAIHTWINKYKGKPEVCEHCKITSEEKRIEWANKDHKCRRNLDDYISLCCECHQRYDRKYNNSKVGRKKNKTNCLEDNLITL